MKPLEIVRLHRTEDVTERPGEWHCGLARARELMLDAPAAQAIDRLARLSAEIDLPNPHGALDLEGVTFAFRPAGVRTSTPTKRWRPSSTCWNAKVTPSRSRAPCGLGRSISADS